MSGGDRVRGLYCRALLEGWEIEEGCCAGSVDGERSMELREGGDGERDCFMYLKKKMSRVRTTLKKQGGDEFREEDPHSKFALWL